MSLPNFRTASPRPSARTRVEAVLALLLIASLLLGACRPAAIAPSASTPTSAPGTTAPSNVPIVDDGAPLPPQVIGRTPKGGQDLPRSGSVEITFDQPMDEASVAAAWRVTGENGKPVKGKVEWPTSRSLRFTPAQPLETGVIYRASLGAEAKSARGLALPDPLSFEFSTAGDLAVSQVFPADGASDVENKALITVMFNRPVVPLAVHEDRGAQPQPITIDPAVAGEGEWLNTSIYIFRPTEPMHGATKYTVTVAAGLQDAFQETSLADDFTWAFTVAPPKIGTLNLPGRYGSPDENHSDVALSQPFEVSFLQPMDPASTEAALSITSVNGDAAPLEKRWNDDFTRLVFTPTQLLALGTEYDLVIGAQALAADGGALVEGLEWRFTTVLPPGIKETNPADGSTQPFFDGTLQIAFASPMNLDSLKDKVVIQPAPKGDVQWWYSDGVWNMTAFVLQPSTNYTVRILPGMADLYGNTIDRETVVRFTTARAQPQANLQMPYMPGIFRVGGPQEFYATYTNVDEVNLSLYRLGSEQFASLLNGTLSQWSYRPSEADLVWQHSESSGGKPDERVLKSFTPDQNGDPLAPGFYFLGIDSPSVPHPDTPFNDTRLLMVASASLTFKTTPNDALVWATDLNTAEPVAGVPVTIYDKGFNAIGEGVTDADGLLALSLPVPDQPYDPRYAITGDGPVMAFAASDWGSGVSPYDFGIWSDYYSEPDQPKGYVYTERPIYRPGQPVYFKGVVRMDDDLAYSLPGQPEVKVSISNYNEKVYEETLPLSPFGTFNAELQLDADAVLGYYSIEVRFPDNPDLLLGSVSFSVAEYRKPEFLLDVTAVPTNVLAGESFNVTVQTDYFSGGVVADADATWKLSTAPYTFQPPSAFSGYSFSNFEEDLSYNYMTYEGQSTEVIAEGQARTGGNGSFALTLPADLSKYNASRQFILEATVTDLAGTAVTGRTTLTAHLSKVYPGVKPRTYVGTAGQPQNFDIVALDWAGEPIAGQKVSVEIVERRWHSVQEQDAQGVVQWSSTVEEIPVASFPDLTTDKDGTTTASFTPSQGGVYRAIVTALDDRGNLGRASAYLWVAGQEYIPWRQTNDRAFKLVADRAAYAPGDTAELLIASPFQGEAYALVTVERGHVRYKDVVKLESNSTLYQLPVTPDMAPNVYVSVLIVKGVDEANPRPNFKVGMLELKVDTRQQALTVELTPDRRTAAPGEQVSYRVRTLDAQGNGVPAEVSMGLSDLAVLTLLGPNSQPILDYFYAHRNLKVWTSMPISLNIEDYNAAIRDYLSQGPGMGAGGGKGGGDLGVVEVRGNFPDTAFWEAQVVTSEAGEATVVVTLPDNLTTWRMEARAVTADTRVGQSTVDIVSGKPLQVRPQTPRFFVPNDQTRLGAAIHNNTGAPLSVNVSLQAEGVTLQSEASQSVQIEAGRQAFVAWDATVNPDAERVLLTFSAEGGGYSDASRPTIGASGVDGLPVYRYEAHETVGASGQMLFGGTQIEGISLPEGVDVKEASLTVKVSPSLAAGMTDALTYLTDYAYDCVEQTVSKFLPNVISVRALQSAGLSDPDLEANLHTEVNTALQRLYNWQNADGGWGWWSGDKSDAQNTAYVTLGLIEAQASGYTVSEDVLGRALGYLSTRTAGDFKVKAPEQLNQQAFILYVLARGGRPDPSKTSLIYEQRQRMAYFARAFLLQTLHGIDAQDPRIAALLSDLNSGAVLSATGTHWEEAVTDKLSWNTDTRTTAIVLSAISSIDPQNPLNANAVRWLMSNRTGDHWYGTQETAWTLMGLTNWMEASGELNADYEFGVALNGEELGGGAANAGTLRQTTELRVDVGKLLQGQINRLAFARTDGAGNMYYTANLDVSMPVTSLEPLDEGVSISRSYYTLTDRNTPITEAKQGDLLLARLTVVAPKTLHNLLVNDPLPAGLEAVDQSLNTSPQGVVPQEYDWNNIDSEGWGWWFFDRVELRDEKVVLSASLLRPGTYVYTYLVRAGTPGAFNVIPPTAQEFYFPEVYGRGAGSQFVVAP